MRGLYAIIDIGLLERRGIDPLAFADAVLAARPAALQLRDKRRLDPASTARDGGVRDTLALLSALRERTRRAGVLLFANDRPDVAALAGCDGVHLGQRDVPPSVAREVFAALRPPTAGVTTPMIGMSVHDDDELAAAHAADPDYLAFGPVYGTVNKAAPEPTIGVSGLAALTGLARALRPRPFVAIGGIDAARAAEVRGVCDCIAVIGALVADAEPYDNATLRAEALVRVMAGEEDA